VIIAVLDRQTIQHLETEVLPWLTEFTIQGKEIYFIPVSQDIHKDFSAILWQKHTTVCALVLGIWQQSSQSSNCLLCLFKRLQKGKGKDHPTTGHEVQKGSRGIALVVLQPRR
jgi:hypothetical protein